MYVSKVKDQFKIIRKARICQGDIYRDLNIVTGASVSPTEAEVEVEDEDNYWVVLNQDCDLNSDHEQRVASNIRDSHNIRTVLICPAYPAKQFFEGNHIPEWNSESFTEKLIERIKNNDQYKRYHYLKGDAVLGVPEMVIDFKHFYTLPIEAAYKQRKKSYLATINELYREDLNHRFSNFLSRIGLPDTV